jgi:hypothetical protein
MAAVFSSVLGAGQHRKNEVGCCTLGLDSGFNLRYCPGWRQATGLTLDILWVASGQAATSIGIQEYLNECQKMLFLRRYDEE